MSALRWDARRGEWVVVAPHRQDRTHQPPAERCPFCPTRDGDAATEIPFERFEIAVFENRFPSLADGGRGARRTAGAGAEPATASARGPDATPARRAGTSPAPSVPGLHSTAPARGRCEVVVYTPEHDGSLGALPVRRIERLIRVWTHRYRELSALDSVRCVFIFENRGAEIGVTLHHPHGQIYAYPFLPPVPARERTRERAHLDATGRCLHCDLLEREESAGERMVLVSGSAAGYVPFAARWPFEAHLVPRAHRASLVQLEPRERRDLAVALKRTLQAYDRLFDRPMPYILAVRQAPTAAAAGADTHLRIELYPARRAADKLKHRAGSETSMGVPVQDVGPEAAAGRLRAAVGA